MCCWPTSSEIPESIAGPDGFIGVLPPRTELVAAWRPVQGDELPEGSLHPAVVALFDAVADREVELDGVEVRQTVVGPSADDHVVEVSVTVTRRV